MPTVRRSTRSPREKAACAPSGRLGSGAPAARGAEAGRTGLPIVPAGPRWVRSAGRLRKGRAADPPGTQMLRESAAPPDPPGRDVPGSLPAKPCPLLPIHGSSIIAAAERRRRAGRVPFGGDDPVDHEKGPAHAARNPRARDRVEGGPKDQDPGSALGIDAPVYFPGVPGIIHRRSPIATVPPTRQTRTLSRRYDTGGKRP